MLLNLANHFQAIRPSVVANENRSLGLEHASDFTQNANDVIEAMQGAVGNDQVEIPALETHVSGIAHLKDRALVEFPGCRGSTGSFNKRSRSVETHGDKILVLPDNLERNQSDTRADIENNPALNAETQRARGKFVFQLARVLALSRFNKSLDIFGRDLRREVQAAGIDKRMPEAAHRRSFNRRSGLQPFLQLLHQDTVLNHVPGFPEECLYVEEQC